MQEGSAQARLHEGVHEDVPTEEASREKGCSLYRHFDKDGILLYVGISKCALGRMSGHAGNSGWYEQIATMTIERFPARSLAEQAERNAISIEEPLHNIYRPHIIGGQTLKPGKPRIVKFNGLWYAANYRKDGAIKYGCGITPASAMVSYAESYWERRA